MLKSPAIMASGVSTIFLPENPIELCDRLKLLLQQKRTGDISIEINWKMVEIIDELFEYECIYTKEQWKLTKSFVSWRCGKQSLGVFLPNTFSK